MTAPALELARLSKVFGGLAACEDVSLEVAPGEVLALVGENGAGKTTLLNLAYGIYRPTCGEVRALGRRLEPGSPRAAIAGGLGMVHQQALLVPPLTVAENVVLGAEPRRSLGRLDRRAAERAVEAISERFGLALDPRARAAGCSVAEQQRIEIARVLFRGAKVLLLDEPTSLLAPAEAEALLAAVRALAREGRSVLLVSHKLREVLAVADRIAVMRRGRLVAVQSASASTATDLASLMVGESSTSTAAPIQTPAATPTPRPPPLVSLRAASALSDRRLPAFRAVDLDLFPGEILAVAGVDGNGQVELAEAVLGLRPLSGGSLARAPGLEARERTAFVPADRARLGLCAGLRVEENLALGRHRSPPFARGGAIDRSGRRSAAARLLGALDVRPADPLALAGSLSGGNQQKLVVARELLAAPDPPRLVVAVHPTRGLDPAASAEVRRRLREAGDGGAAVLLVSLDLDEVRALGDRIAVMADRRVVALLPAGSDEREIGRHMLAHGEAARA